VRIDSRQKKAHFEFCMHELKGLHMCADGDEQWPKILEIREKLKEYSESEPDTR
jgi:hypothetical protein